MAQEQQLEKLLQLAQIQKLLAGPEQEQQQIEQQDQQRKMALAVQLMGLQQEAKNQDEQRKLQRLGIEETVKGREATAKGNIMESLISHLGQRGDVPLSALADTLERGGHAELAGSLRTMKEEGTKKNIAGHIARMTALKDPTQVGTYLSSITDPDELAGVQALLPPTATEGGPSPVAPNEYPGYAPGLGGSIGNVLKYLPIDTANLGASLFNNLILPPNNLLGSLIGTPPARRVQPMKREYTMANLGL